MRVSCAASSTSTSTTKTYAIWARTPPRPRIATRSRWSPRSREGRQEEGVDAFPLQGRDSPLLAPPDRPRSGGGRAVEAEGGQGAAGGHWRARRAARALSRRHRHRAYGVDGEDLGWVTGSLVPTPVAGNPHGVVQAGVHGLLLDAA